MFKQTIDHPYPLATDHRVAAAVPDASAVAAEAENPIQARIYKFNNEVVYEQLLAPAIPFDLDYFQVFQSLCDVLGCVQTSMQHASRYRAAP